MFNEGKNIVTDNFILFREEEEIFIIYTYNMFIINWYKLYHIGRCINLSYNISEKEMINILYKLKRN